MAENKWGKMVYFTIHIGLITPLITRDGAYLVRNTSRVGCIFQLNVGKI